MLSKEYVTAAGDEPHGKSTKGERRGRDTEGGIREGLCQGGVRGKGRSWDWEFQVGRPPGREGGGSTAGRCCTPRPSGRAMTPWSTEGGGEEQVSSPSCHGPSRGRETTLSALGVL